MGGRRPDAEMNRSMLPPPSAECTPDRKPRERRPHTHGKRLACFRPRERFRFVPPPAQEEDEAEGDAFEHVVHAEEHDRGDDEQQEEGQKKARARVATLSKRKRKLQLKFAMEQLQLHQQQVMCDCEYQVFRCQLIHPDDSWAVLEESYVHRVKKWSDKFDGHDWRQERICQKWKDNQKKFMLEVEATERKDSRQHNCGSATDAIIAADGDRNKDDDKSEPCCVEAAEKMSPSKAGKAVKQVLSNFASAAEVLLLSRQFDSLLRSGIPPHLRGRVWWMCSGAAEKQSAARDSYPDLVKRLHTLSKCASMEIEKDLPRTFPVDQHTASEDQFRHTSMGELRRILQAYSLRNPTIGYCQSMNFLAAVLLHHMEEEEAFWVLVAMVEELTPHYHTRSMAGSRADQRVFSDLVQQKLPALYEHMQSLGVDFEPFTLKWFLCSFLNTLPFEPVMRIWDVLFCEGSHVLLRVGLALLKLNQPRIMACDDAMEVYEMFKISHETLLEITTPYRSGLLNRDECVCDTLIRLTMDKSFVGPIPFDSLHELRQYYRNDIEVEYAEMEARRPKRASIASSSTEATTASTNGGDDDQRSSYPRAASSVSGEDVELLDYDFIEEYTGQELEVSPSKFIHFRDLYDSEDGSDYFIDVNYEYTLQHCR